VAKLFTSLPRHLYCMLERRYVRSGGDGLERCTWFGLTSVPGRAWGLTVLLENGAIYSHLPPNALVFETDSIGVMGKPKPWAIEQSQLWDCFGYDFAVEEYSYLAGRTVRCSVTRRQGELLAGEYLFTAQHYGDGYSSAPDQAKQYHFIKLELGRLTCLPANRFVVDAAEFTTLEGSLPKGLRRQTESYSCE
jgi:hypothetical protein